jgi:hypothetical protein
VKSLSLFQAARERVAAHCGRLAASLRSRATAALAALIALGWLAPGCELINPEEIVPAYIRVDTVLLAGDPSTQGALSHNIGDVWVVAGDVQTLAAYEMPTVFPVFANGPTRIVLQPGIRRNGFSNSREAYPLYTFFDVERNLQPLDTVVLVPEVRYLDDVVFSLIENFETGNNFTLVPGSAGGFTVISDPALVFEGNSSALLSLGDPGELSEIRSTERSLPSTGQRPVYVEIDYRNNHNIDVWLRTIPVSGEPFNSYIVTMGPQENWNKIYINLTDFITTTNPGTVYQVALRTFRDARVENPEILLDNIKLVYR